LFFLSFCLFVVEELSSSSKSTWEDSYRFAQCLRKWWSRFFLFFSIFFLFFLSFFCIFFWSLLRGFFERVLVALFNNNCVFK
jgi:hypothetical protein